MESTLEILQSYLLEMVVHVLLNVLDGIKSFPFAFIVNFDRREKCQPELSLCMGKGFDHRTPF
jgi:hypothetical protein